MGNIDTYIVLKDLFNLVRDEYFEGYYIAKISIIRSPLRVITSEVTYKIINKKNIIILKSSEFLDSSSIYEIQTTFFKPSINKNGIKTNKTSKSSEKIENDYLKEDDFRIDEDDMSWFYDNCNDTNSIHYGDKKIVPAVVILKKINNYLKDIIKANNSVSIKFYKPIRLTDCVTLNYTKDLKLELFKKTLSKK